MRRTKEYLLKVCKEFFNIDNIREIKELTGGHINETYEVAFDTCRYVLQQLNSHVFYSPIGVMNNINLIIEHIRKKVVYNGMDPSKYCLNFIKTQYGQSMAIVDDEYWRCMEFIEGGYTLEQVTCPKDFEEIGRAIGNFQDLLSDFHTRTLDDSIKHFHDTPYRFERFKEILDLDKFERSEECYKEIAFIYNREDQMNKITSKIETREIPRRVTHNDTKSSNIMLDVNTHEFLCLIDLDTVMKGSLLYDYGDALRFGASTAAEDEEDLSKIGINLELIRAFTRGFLREMKPLPNQIAKPISKTEIELLYEGYHIITLELGMRFLHDYIEGDHYFRIDPSKPKHNLIRARAQFKLVEVIEANEKKIKEIINEILRELDYDESNLIDVSDL